MAKKRRIELIKKLEKERGGTHIISYITSTRHGMETPMSMDCIRKIYEHLRHINKSKDAVKIDLFIHSDGGQGIVPWKLVTLIREYCNYFSVLVPCRAFSAATLTALGADSIVMHPMGMLGPTDPKVANRFNPTDDSGQPIWISVEDVTAFINLVKEDAGIQHEDELIQAFNILVDKVHPLALGNVKRSLSQSRVMAQKLLSLHMDVTKKQHEIDEIVENLTSKSYYHGHPIGRNEAAEHIKIPTITMPSPDCEEIMWNLYLEYEKELKMEEPFQPVSEFLNQYPDIEPETSALTTPTRAKVVYVESVYKTDVVMIDYQISGRKTNEGVINTLYLQRRQSWETE